MSIEILCNPGQHVEDRSEDTRLVLAGAAALSTVGDQTVLYITHRLFVGIAEEEWTSRVAAAGVQDTLADSADIILGNRSTLVVVAADIEILAFDHRLQQHRGRLLLLRSAPAGNVKALIVSDVPRIAIDGQTDGFNVCLEGNWTIEFDQGNVIFDGVPVRVRTYLLDAILLVRRQALPPASSQKLAILFSVQIVLSHTHSDAAREIRLDYWCTEKEKLPGVLTLLLCRPHSAPLSTRSDH